MSAAAMLKKAIGFDAVESFEKRFAEVESDTAAALAEKTRAEETLHTSEKAGDVKAADSAAATLAAVENKLVRFRARRLAVTEGLAEAKASRASQEKAVRVDALTAKQARAGKDADEAQAKSVALMSSLGDALGAYFAAARTERDSVDALAREDGSYVVGYTGSRGLSYVEEAARVARMAAGGASERLEVSIPMPVE